MISYFAFVSNCWCIQMYSNILEMFSFMVDMYQKCIHAVEMYQSLNPNVLKNTSAAAKLHKIGGKVSFVWLGPKRNLKQGKFVVQILISDMELK